MCRHVWFRMSKLAEPYLRQYRRPRRLVCTHDSRHHELHFREKTDGNGPIFIEIWSGEVGWCDDEFGTLHLPGRIFVNIGSLEPYNTSKCRSLCRLSFAESRRWYEPGILFNNTIECRGTLVSWWELFFFVLFPTWSVLRPSVGSTNSAKSSTRRAVRCRQTERQTERQRKNFYMLVFS